MLLPTLSSNIGDDAVAAGCFSGNFVHQVDVVEQFHKD